MRNLLYLLFQFFLIAGIQISHYSLEAQTQSSYKADGNFTIFNSWDFESEELGHQRTDDQGIDGHSSCHAASYGFDLEVQLDEYDEIYMSYNLKFSNEFNSTEGGKLPGLAGFPLIQTMKYALPEQGFSAIHKYKQAGSLISYNHDQTTGQVPWVTGTYLYDTIYFNNGQWYNFTKWLKMNIFSNGFPNNDGICEIWVDGCMIFKETNRIFMAIESPTMKIDGMHIANWYGGGANQFYEPLAEMKTSL